MILEVDRRCLYTAKDEILIKYLKEYINLRGFVLSPDAVPEYDMYEIVEDALMVFVAQHFGLEEDSYLISDQCVLDAIALLI